MTKKTNQEPEDAVNVDCAPKALLDKYDEHRLKGWGQEHHVQCLLE